VVLGPDDPSGHRDQSHRAARWGVPVPGRPQARHPPWLGLSRSTLWRYVKAGLLEPDLVTAGGHFRFDPEHVRRQIRAPQQRGDG
jgi:hypothetical protein